MQTETFIPGKDASLESTIDTMQQKLAARGFHLDESSWLNPVESIWSVHVRDRECPMLFANGKGATKLAARASALGEFFERLNTHYFWTHFYLGATRANRPFVHYPQERWFAPTDDGKWPAELLNPELHAFYNPEGDDRRRGAGRSELRQRGARHLRAALHAPARRRADVDSGQHHRQPVCEQRHGGRQHDDGGAHSGLVGNFRAPYQDTASSARACACPKCRTQVIARYPGIAAGIKGLREAGFGILVRDASLGGRYPVMNVTLLHPKDQGCFASFGAHPRFEVALERALTELLQGRALDALESFPEPGFDMEEITMASNLEIHFVDSSGVISWNFLGDTPDFPFCRLELQHHHRGRLRVAVRLHQGRGQGHLRRGLHRAGRLQLPHPGAGHVRDLSGRRSGVGKQQRRQPHPPGAGQAARR